MSDKSVVMLGMIIGSTIGGYIPVLFGSGIFSYWSLISSTIGGILGIWVGLRMIS